ncbi:sirohydrochlorin cobaltochelatase [Caminicella sporogenes DSM 14501]|uniref:Sirohydrochlorin cobaltochelatase n=1 Tax=Caminicella sporogenes DSM 14501 TaxID=1121266 RepID=A0A1M6PFI6_9FIRM|nr:sirohydrochlorin cobaltochelatase [Caminicella sporogenes]RKD21416.1 sirohydrochlorin cobaltochelatase [Caminicella sporogenes]WIF95444.1 sirohydrochlorin cobaltochelatase [Caminicella sporogenes]SHK06715.1 sirohydrochlorin cobaltochelatase [Caminicella sporogenes DSM 14501]
MKKMLVLMMVFILALGATTGCSQKPQEVSKDPNKKAILVVSFGTSYADTRKLTIEATEKRFAEEFPDYDIVRAFTAQTIINILKERDKIDVYNVKEALDYLKSQKYSEVIIQPLHIMNGAEYDELLAQVAAYEGDFDKLKVGKPLLTTTEDYLEVVKALKAQLPELKDDEAVVFMGHGTHHFANATYSELEYVLHDLGHKNVFVGTVEGYPGLEQVMNRLKENNIKKVTLMPFMLVAGDHATNDMAGDEDDSWKTVLKKAGYEVEVYLHGLGENKGIQDIYLKHAHEAIKGQEEAHEE